MPKHKRKDDPLTHEELISRLHYDKETGLFTWIKHVKKWLVGRRAGARSGTGHRYIEINYISYSEHRLAWFYVMGVWPEAEIDHEDRVRDNNKFSNLRPATLKQQRANAGKNRNNSSGYRGVFLRPENGRWRAAIGGDNGNVCLGTFIEIEDAVRAYDAAALEKWGPQFYTPQLPTKQCSA
jgi:hypothetical protein